MTRRAYDVPLVNQWFHEHCAQDYPVKVRIIDMSFCKNCSNNADTLLPCYLKLGSCQLPKVVEVLGSESATPSPSKDSGEEKPYEGPQSYQVLPVHGARLGGSGSAGDSLMILYFEHSKNINVPTIHS